MKTLSRLAVAFIVVGGDTAKGACNIQNCVRIPLYECSLHACGGRINLDVDDSGVYGTIPSVLGSIGWGIEDLNLEDNNLSGSIPGSCRYVLFVDAVSTSSVCVEVGVPLENFV